MKGGRGICLQYDFMIHESIQQLSLLTNVGYLALLSVFPYPTLACKPIFFLMLALPFNQKRADRIH